MWPAAAALVVLMLAASAEAQDVATIQDEEVITCYDRFRSTGDLLGWYAFTFDSGKACPPGVTTCYYSVSHNAVSDQINMTCGPVCDRSDPATRRATCESGCQLGVKVSGDATGGTGSDSHAAKESAAAAAAAAADGGDASDAAAVTEYDVTVDYCLCTSDLCNSAAVRFGAEVVAPVLVVVLLAWVLL